MWVRLQSTARYWRSFLPVWDHSALAQVRLLFESSIFENGVLIDSTYTLGEGAWLKRDIIIVNKGKGEGKEEGGRSGGEREGKKEGGIREGERFATKVIDNLCYHNHYNR